MATIYNFDVSVVSAFSAYPSEVIEQIIRKALEDYQNPETGLKLESIKIERK